MSWTFRVLLFESDISVLPMGHHEANKNHADEIIPSSTNILIITELNKRPQK